MKKKILIAEDEPGILYVLQRSLLNLDFDLEILSASSGQDALRILQQNSDIKLIVTDIVMPGMTGLELREYQLADESLKHIPFIFLTGNLQHIPKAKELAPHVVLTKPVMPEDFCTIVENILF